MSVLEKKLEQLKKQQRLGLMTHVVVGFPTLQDTITIVKTMVKEGADIVELQIPFSDPLADGPTIMKACEDSLKAGTTVKDCFFVMRQLSQEVSVPLLFMSYYNIIFHYGVEKFCRDAQKAGAAGLIVPDASLEEEDQEHFIRFCRKYGLHNIQVVSPAATKKRIQANATVASGFVYCTALQGITGARKSLDPTIVEYLKIIKRYFSVPVAVGFGISKKEHINALKDYADIVVVGSALIDVINSSDKRTREKNVSSFIRKLKMVD